MTIPWSNPSTSLIVVSAGTGFQGIYVYNPTPAANNLIYSEAPAATTDPYGNAVFGGTTTYSVQAGTYYAFNISGSGFPPRLSWYTAASQAGPYTLLYQFSDLASGAVHGLNMQTVPFAVPPAAWSAGLFASDPAGANAGVIESWHNFGALAIAGWTVSLAQYKLLADSGLAMVRIQNLAPSTHPADGTVVWAAANGLPAPYRPVNAQRQPASTQQGDGVGQSASLQFQTDGSVQVNGITGTTTTRLDCYAILATV